MTTNRRSFLKQLGLGAAGLGLTGALPWRGWAQDATRLPHATPEAMGISSEAILAFLDALGKSRHEFHSFILVRHGQVVAEGWWSPYRPDLNHMLYSMSKSFTSTGIGFAVTEGRLKVDDRVAAFFPEDLPENVSDHLNALRVKDLLTMSVGHGQDSTGAIRESDNWVKNFLALPIPNPPGSVFLYNSGATYMLSAIVQKVTGQRLIDYLRPRLFGPLGVEGMTWDTCPRGINVGGWGLNLRTEGLAKFGQLFLQKGIWQGRQIIPAAWVEEATSFKIQQPVSPNAASTKDRNDWLQGYCYQFWRSRRHAYRGDGAFGQFTIVMPEQDAVLAITSETSDMQGELNLVWEHLQPAMQDQALPANPNALADLRIRLAALTLQPPRGESASPWVDKISGRDFVLEDNELKLNRVSFRFKDRTCLFTASDDRGDYPVVCGLRGWRLSETSVPGTPPNLVSERDLRRSVVSKTAASATWTDENTLQMTWRFNETPHHDTVNCRFEGDKVQISFRDSMVAMNPSAKDRRPVLTGRLSA